MQPAKEILAHFKDRPFDELCRAAVSLGAAVLQHALAIQTRQEKKLESQIASMMKDPAGKTFAVALTDQCFRSSNALRTMARYRSLLEQFGVPAFLSWDKRLGMQVLRAMSKVWPGTSAVLLKSMLRQATASVLIPGEATALTTHILKRQSGGVRINLNRLGEAILGEREAAIRLQMYIEDLKNKDIECISIKISTLYSQINLLARQRTLHLLQERLRILYRTAQLHPFTQPDGTRQSKFVNLDMEEYRDLHLTVDIFCNVLSEAEFLHLSAGIVLQSYLPDSFAIQQQLTEWALLRCKRGGAPIRIRIVKGANLAMEQVDAALHGWPQAPYTSKTEVDANYKRMLLYASERTSAVHIGVASHNLFDICLALLLRTSKNLGQSFSFEMLEGMADHIRRAVQEVSGDMLLYCPAVTKGAFQNGIAYLIRRLDENSAPENFLHCLFSLSAKAWKEQQDQFLASTSDLEKLSSSPRRTQNRQMLPQLSSFAFKNEPDTDWSLPHNVKWGQDILETWEGRQFETIPLVCGKEELAPLIAKGQDPSSPEKKRYRYCLATHADVDQALDAAQNAFESWQNTSLAERKDLLCNIAEQLRTHRGDLMGSLVLDAGKSLQEADVEVSEAIDFAEYYRHSLQALSELPDIEWHPKGVILVASPWNFPCSISAGGILAALATGNVVLFKPAPEAVLVGWTLAQLFWEAGVDKSVLQFINCTDEPVGSALIQDTRLSAVILTGATPTARAFLNMRPGIDLMAETGGKNSIIVTAMADRDLAIKDILRSAFGHAGQKCSACSLAILEAEVYDSKSFQQQLLDAASSLPVGSAWDASSFVTPLIKQPDGALLRGLQSLEPGETWGLQPQRDVKNPQLWSPGIKFGVQPHSFTHQTELFGPVLGIMRADSLEHAILLANGTPYGLTGGLHSLDEAEKEQWRASIDIGNAYINRTITGAIVERQPFGGCKASSFGRGLKAGGPNYLVQMRHAIQKSAPLQQAPLTANLQAIETLLDLANLSAEDRALWQVSAKSYVYHWQTHFSKTHDPSAILGQQNWFMYRSLNRLCVRLQPAEKLVDLFCMLAAATVAGCTLEISGQGQVYLDFANCFKNYLHFNLLLKDESEEAFQTRIAQAPPRRLRMTALGASLCLAEISTGAIIQPVLANGRLELLNYVQEMSLSHDVHRYGNLYQDRSASVR